MKNKHHKKKEEERKADEESKKKEIKRQRKVSLKNLHKKIKSSKNLTRYSTTLLIIILLLFSFYVRMLPKQLSITDVWAKNAVYNSIKENILNNINKYYPNLPEAQKQQLVNSQFQAFMNNETQRQQINEEIKYVSQEFKKQFEYTKDGQTHILLGDIDSYYWLRWARNLVDKHQYCDAVIDGKCMDTHMIAPFGTTTSKRPHPYMIYLTYKIGRIFNKKLDLMQASYATMVILSLLVTLFAFFLGKEIGGNVAGFFTSLIITVNPFYIMRVSGSDDDVYNFLLPIIIFWLFIKTMKSKTKKETAIYSVLTAITIGIYSFTWSGWWFSIDMLFGGAVLFLIVKVVEQLIKDKKISGGTKKTALILITLFLMSWISVGVVKHSPTRFISSLITSPLHESTTLKEVAKSTGWPNVFNTVAELNPGSIKQIVNGVGGKLNFAIAIIGVLALVTVSIIKERKYENKENIELLIASILVVWMLGATYATLKGVRFVLLFIPPFIAAYGAAMGLAVEYSLKVIEKVKNEKLNKTNRGAIKAVVFLMLLLISVPAIKTGIATSKTYIPNMTSTWYISLNKIRMETSPNAILNSWWDFGHWFKYLADRRVTADGASQNTPQAYWLGKILVENNETRAVQILRMLDCGANKAFDIINSKYQNTVISIEIINKLQKMNKSEIKTYLQQQGFNNTAIKEVINYTKCNPPEDYFITSDDMIGKAGVWAHFGLWDFKKAEALNIAKKNGSQAIKYMEEKLGYSKVQAINEYNKIISFQGNSAKEQAWISPWPGYASTRGRCTIANNEIICLNTLQGQYTVKSVFNLSSREADIIGSSGNIKPKEVVVYYNGYEFKRTYNDSQLNLAWVLFVNGDQVRSIYTSPELAESLFTKLYFGEGYGMKYFKLFSEEGPSPVGTRVQIWNVTWDKLRAKNGSRVSVLYIGYFKNGTVFDSSIINWKNKNITNSSDFKDYILDKPLTFTIGKNQVIPGFEKGVMGMEVGDEKLIEVPPKEGYKTGQLAGKTLYFKVRVVKIE